jgi:hypothetical protein
MWRKPQIWACTMTWLHITYRQMSEKGEMRVEKRKRIEHPPQLQQMMRGSHLGWGLQNKPHSPWRRWMWWVEVRSRWLGGDSYQKNMYTRL